MLRFSLPVLAVLTLGAAPAAAAELFVVAGLPRGGKLALREAPDADSASVAEVPVGARLLGFGCTNETPSGNTWCRVRANRGLGWARRRYLAPI